MSGSWIEMVLNNQNGESLISLIFCHLRVMNYSKAYLELLCFKNIDILAISPYKSLLSVSSYLAFHQLDRVIQELREEVVDQLNNVGLSSNVSVTEGHCFISGPRQTHQQTVCIVSQPVRLGFVLFAPQGTCTPEGTERQESGNSCRDIGVCQSTLFLPSLGHT